MNTPENFDGRLPPTCTLAEGSTSVYAPTYAVGRNARTIAEQALTPCLDHGKNLGKQVYAFKWRHGKNVLLHRFVYCQSRGIALAEIDGLVVRHSCDNPRCINPGHLLLGTQADNMRDKAVRRRDPKVKLTEAQVAEIRATCVPNKPRDRHTANPLSYHALGRKFGVDPATIRNVYRGVTFAHVKVLVAMRTPETVAAMDRARGLV